MASDPKTDSRGTLYRIIVGCVCSVLFIWANISIILADGERLSNLAGLALLSGTILIWISCYRADHRHLTLILIFGVLIGGSTISLGFVLQRRWERMTELHFSLETESRHANAKARSALTHLTSEQYNQDLNGIKADLEYLAKRIGESERAPTPMPPDASNPRGTAE